MSNIIVLQLQLSEKMYRALQEAAQQAQSSETDVAVTAIQSYLAQLTTIDPLLGLFAEETTLIDEITDDILLTRETATF